MPKLAFFAPLLLVLSGCMVGPNYQRPAVPAPPVFRGSTEPSTTPASLADTKWFDLFHDDQLTTLVKTALAQNYDLRAASARVLEARAQYGIQRSFLFPTINGDAQFAGARASAIGQTPYLPSNLNSAVTYTQAGFTLGWEIDVWGRLRRLTEAARAQYLASEEARLGVITTLVGDVSNDYFTLREADAELEIARKTRDNAERGLSLTTIRRKGGTATSLDVRQSEQFFYTATATIAAAERQVEQTEDLISLLLAKNPGAVPRGKALDDFTVPPSIPSGLPSSLLERRPDIRQAEANLIAANANIGAARAQYFPQITLSGLVAGQSRALTALFTGPAQLWTFAPDATVPIFNAGRIRNNVRLTEAQRQEQLARYEQTIQTAFREVSDALSGYHRISEQRAQEDLLVKALRDADRLSTLRYKGGLDSYLQVLDAERNLFQGELDLARLKRDQLISVVNLYRALGGGWQ